MKVLCVGYREWALSIYDKLKKHTNHQYHIIRSESNFNSKIIYDYKPDIILFYGWSKIISNEIVNNYKCIMLHPSPLPKYRGGSPIQNQIINGETISAVTLFLMDEGMDTGPILAQKEISLDGNLCEIFKRISNIGYELTIKIVTEGLKPIPQDHQKATVYKRRKPYESEITIEEIQKKPAEYIHNKIRMLQDPYPNAFIRAGDNEKLFLIMAKIEENN